MGCEKRGALAPSKANMCWASMNEEFVEGGPTTLVTWTEMAGAMRIVFLSLSHLVQSQKGKLQAQHDSRML